MPTEKKAGKIGDLKELLQRSPLQIITEYRGMTVAEIQDLRGKLRPSGTEYHVTKNTLLRRAANEVGLTGLEETFAGPTAIVFLGEDMVGGIKNVLDYAKGAQKFVIKNGVLSGKVIDAKRLEDITKLPKKEEQIAKIMGSLNAPASNLVNVMSQPPRNLVTVLAATTRNLVNVLEQRRLQLDAPAS